MRILTATFLFLIALVQQAVAWSGPISRPEYYAPKGCPPEVMKQVGAALNRKDCKFVQGRFFSLSASWTYSGNTFALNGFLKALSECPGARIVISTNSQFNSKGDWRVYTHPVSEHFFFRITINGKSERIVQKAMKIPSLHGPKLEIAPSAKVETLEFADRLKLSEAQEELLRLRKRSVKKERESSGPVEEGKDVAEFEKKLGADLVVRQALANELMVLPDQPPGTSIIYNPTLENLVFNVAVKGQEVLLGSQKMSVAHETWLQPGGRLRIENLYWTSPAMAREK